jgi:adenosine 3'-phospho 5'-phosphosulfate transporter B2
MGTSSNIRISVYFFGITACFTIYSLIQERLMTVGFGDGEHRETFRYSAFVVFVNRIVTIITSAIVLIVLDLSLAPAAPIYLYGVPSLANVVGSVAQYEALKYVSFPVQALAKCAKSVPVMAWSWITRARRYYMRDYIAAGVVTLGCALFVLTGDISSPTLASVATGASNIANSQVKFTSFGLTLLSVFIVFDGLTCTVQDKLFSSYDMHSCNQLMYVSCWSALLTGLFLMMSGQMRPALEFVGRHPDSLQLMLLQSCVSTTVQLFISFTIKQYGALNFALVMTIRQYVSIVFSCWIFKHDLTLMQWVGTLFVVSGLVQRAVNKQGKKSPLPTNHSNGKTVKKIDVIN